MPDASIIASILVVHWLVTMSPGANTVLVAQTATAGGRLNAFAVIAGICLSGAIWVASAALGLKAVFLAFPWLYAFVSYAGAAYLIWLGVGLLRSKPRAIEGQPTGCVPKRLSVSFAQGFASNITNPKTPVYFSSVFGAFMPLDAGPATVVAVVLVTWTCNFGWYGGLSFLLSGTAAVWPPIADHQSRGRAGDDPVRTAGGGRPPAVAGKHQGARGHDRLFGKGADGRGAVGGRSCRCIAGPRRLTPDRSPSSAPRPACRVA